MINLFEYTTSMTSDVCLLQMNNLFECTSMTSDVCFQMINLCLSHEEKILLLQQGIVLPSDMPLTKQEEKALRAVRRKIRNKVRIHLHT